MVIPISKNIIIILLLLSSSLFLLPTLSSTIATFSDAACKDSLDSISGPNGYPNGTCTPLNTQGAYGSFQIIDLDPGCSVTLYAYDELSSQPCSGAQLEFPLIAKCYNTSWIYYSIDLCTPPGENTLSTVAPAPTSTNTSPASSDSQSQSQNNGASSKIGAIVGGVVGGVCVLALVAGLVFFSVRRNRKKLQQQQYQAGQATSTYAPQEIAGAPVPEFGTTEVKEIYTHQAGSGSQDVGRSNYYVPPPVELQGDVVGPDGAPGVGSRWQW